MSVGACGEIAQGFTSGGRPFHVSCPIETSATISVALRPAREFSVQHPGRRLDKVEMSLLRTAEYLNIEPCEIRFSHWSDIDVGKGMSSSTADVIAAARALAAAVDRTLNPTELAAIAVSIESSGAPMYPEILAYDHKAGVVVQRYEWWPQFVLAIVIPPETFNTESANFSGKEVHGKTFDALLAQLEEGAKKRDALTFAQVATESAKLNQDYVPNPYFALLEDRFEEFGADGILVAHTGTVVALLFNAESSGARKAAAGATVDLQEMFPNCKVQMSITPPCRNV